VRTALYNYLFARQHGGDLIFRIEDTDSNRFVPGAEEYIIESFKWLGINFDEGVSFGGNYGPYRVLDICHQAKQLPLVEKFKGDSLTFVAGSSWGPDEDIFIKYFNEHPEMKLVIAPHVVSDSHLREILDKVKRPCIRYTEATEENVTQADCLIIDCYGLLSSIYRYGEISYIGGGFGVGIHNVLEAAVYGIPVIFGPNNKKFREAQHLLEQKGGFEVTGYDDFKRLMDKFLSDEAYLQQAGKAAGNYVNHNSGALEKIMKDITL
jgi:3-deoxy-D-manno-octulosonic-acid transferase